MTSAAEALRAEFPVLERLAYLNAGTDGPLPRRATDAAAARLDAELARGRSGPAHLRALDEMRSALRARVASLLGCAAEEVGLTHSTTDGINAVLAGLELGPGDEVLTSDEEHPGLLAPLAAGRRRAGYEIRLVPFAELPGEVGPSTRLVACSHVSWISGRVMDTYALARTGVSTLLDGAQGLGAVPVDVGELGCDFYAAAGQKWLCGPDGGGYLFVRSERIESVAPPWPNYLSLADPGRALELPFRSGADRFDTGVQPGALLAAALAALDVLDTAGWPWVFDRGTELARRLAAQLAEGGLEVAPRGASTLVSWAAADARAEVERLAAEGFVVRDLPGRGLVRASVGAWSEEAELERLAALVLSRT